MTVDDRMPRITVVTPSFQHGEFLEATMESVLSQNYPNLEYIVIDGGSMDGSVEILKKYAGRLSYWCSEADGGQYDAINKGFMRSSGEILCWLNSDDMYYPWTLRTVASIFMQLAEVEWITSLQHGFWDRHGYCLGFQNVPGFSREAFLEGCYADGGGGGGGSPFLGYVQQESTFWRRRLWDRAGGALRGQFSLAADFDLWGRFYGEADLYGVASPLGGFRMNAGQRSTQAGEYGAQAAASLAECRGAGKGLIRVGGAPYRGKRIVRKGREREVGFWAVEEYAFS